MTSFLICVSSLGEKGAMTNIRGLYCVELWPIGANVKENILRITILGNKNPTETLNLNSEKMMILAFQDNFKGDDENGQMERYLS